MKSLQDRIVLITGAGGAMGSAVAEGCAAEGATVVLLGRRQQPLEATYDRIAAAGGKLPFILPCDLSGLNDHQAHALAQAVHSEFGILHGLVHCAADVGVLCPLSDVEAEDWQRLLAVNLTAPFLLTRALLPLLATAGDAEVLFVSDPAARSKAFWGAYGVAKAGLEQLAATLAEEWSGRLRVNVLGPAPFRSALRRRCFPGEKPESLPSAQSAAAFAVHRLAPSTAAASGRIFDSKAIAAFLSPTS